LDDEAAVDRVLAGDASGFEFIVRRWQGPIVNLAYRFCRDRSRAQDLSQEAFLRAFRALPKWRRDGAFSTWLFALATKLFCSEIRRRAVPSELSQEHVEAKHSISLEGGLASEQQAGIVRRAVQSLPPRYREAVILFYFHDMDISQAARSLKLPEGTLKARLSRARDILRQKLGGTATSRESGGTNAT
jgi:RNA polymerase sigma-70 factor (ECF subfamily)